MLSLIGASLGYFPVQFHNQQDQKLASSDALASAILLISILRQLFTFPSLFLGTFTFDTLGTNSDTFDTGNTLDTLNAFDWWQS